MDVKADIAAPSIDLVIKRHYVIRTTVVCRRDMMNMCSVSYVRVGGHDGILRLSSALARDDNDDDDDDGDDDGGSCLNVGQHDRRTE